MSETGHVAASRGTGGGLGKACSLARLCPVPGGHPDGFGVRGKGRAGFAGPAPLPTRDVGTPAPRAVLRCLPRAASLGDRPWVSQPCPTLDLLRSRSRDREVSAGPEPAVLGLDGGRKTWLRAAKIASTRRGCSHPSWPCPATSATKNLGNEGKSSLLHCPLHHGWG